MPITLEEISYSLDLKKKLKKIPASERKGAKELIGNFLLDAIFNDLQSAKSPVTGGRFKKLSDDYREIKVKKGKAGIPDLDLTSRMLENLKAKNTKDGIKLEITKSKEKKKAHGHNTGGGNLPKRQFLPDDKARGKGSKFRPDIRQGIESIINDFIEGES